MKSTQPIFRLEKVHKAFDRTPVLSGVDLEIQPSQTTVVIGPSGCGKSVLLKHMIGLMKPDRGKVFFHEQEVSSMDERRLASIRRQMGFLFQGGALFDSMTVEENIIFPMSEHNVGTQSERLRRCGDVLSLVALEGYEKRYPEELSGGQKKRVALARAIVLHPEVILYDEPTTGLDPIRADLINELILKLQNVLGTTAVVVTHDMTSARKIATRIVMLHEGHFIVDTTPDQLDHIDNEIVTRFIEGRASAAELAELEKGGLEADINRTGQPQQETTE